MKRKNLPSSIFDKIPKADRKRLKLTEREAPIHRTILKECKVRGWVALHGRMDQRTGRTAGEPDFVILMPNGKHLLIECKTTKSKLSPAQAAMISNLDHLGHIVWVIRGVPEWEGLVRFITAIQPLQK